MYLYLGGVLAVIILLSAAYRMLPSHPIKPWKEILLVALIWPILFFLLID